MDDKLQTIAGAHGRFTRQENGLIYFYKADGIVTEKASALEYLESVRALDDSGTARLIVVQGRQIEYTFEAQHILLTNTYLGGLAFVTETKSQILTAELLKELARTFKAKFPVGIFDRIEEAEKWLLTLAN